MDVFIQKASEMKAPLRAATLGKHPLYPSDLQGSYQMENQATVLEALAALSTLNIDPKCIQTGLQKVVAQTGLRGRWERLGDKPAIVADTAHNAQGLAHTLKQAVQEAGKGQLHLVLGFASDKDLEAVWPLLPRGATYYLCAAQIKRAKPAAELLVEFRNKGFSSQAYPSVNEALMAAKSAATEEDVIYVGGSTFVVAEIL